MQYICKYIWKQVSKQSTLQADDLHFCIVMFSKLLRNISLYRHKAAYIYFCSLPLNKQYRTQITKNKK